MFLKKTAKSASPLRPQQKKKQSMRQRRLRSIRKTRSLGDLSKEVPDDLTRDTNARMRINGRQKMTWKGRNKDIPAIHWKGKASSVDYIQTLPRELQSKVFKMGRMENPMNSRNEELKSATLAMASSIQLKKIFQQSQRQLLNSQIYAIARSVYNSNLTFSTPNFYVDYKNQRAHISLRGLQDDRKFYNTIEDFIRETKIEYKLEDDCILYRIVPTIAGYTYDKNKYDGFISNQKKGENRFDWFDVVEKHNFRKNGYKQIRTFRMNDYFYYILHVDLNYKNDGEVKEEDDDHDDYCEYIGSDHEQFEEEL